MTSGNGLLEVGLPIAIEFATPSDDEKPGVALERAPWRNDDAQTVEADDFETMFGPQNARKRYDDEEDDASGDEEVEFDVDDGDEEGDLAADEDDDFDDDDDDDFDDDDDDDADDFDDE